MSSSIARLETLINAPGRVFDEDDLKRAYAEDFHLIASRLNGDFLNDNQVLFGKYLQDSVLHWDNTNKRLGIGASSPKSVLDVRASDPKLIITDTRTGSWPNDTVSGTIEFYSEDPSASGPGAIAQIQAVENAEQGEQTAIRPDLIFKTTDRADPAYSMVETMRLVGLNQYCGIGVSTPRVRLEVNGGVRLNTATAKPTCNSAIRGTFWAVASGAGVKDTVEVCAKDAADAYVWRPLY